jgi:adenosylmethionine-8-amino-7-oxononanoate aminotransferase
MEAVVRKLLEPLRAHPLVGDYRGAGLIFGVELVDRTRPGEAPFDLGTRVLAALRDRGVLSFVLSPGNLLLLCPALVIRESELQELISCLRSALDDVARERGLGPSA